MFLCVASQHGTLRAQLYRIKSFKSNPAVITVCVSFLIHMSLLGSAEGFACHLAASGVCDDEKVEFMKEVCRTVLEMVDADMIEFEAWKLLVVASAKASVNMKSGVGIREMSNMTFNSLVCKEGDLMLYELHTHRFAGNLKRELPSLKEIVDKLAQDKYFEWYWVALEMAQHDIKRLMEGLEKVRK